MTFGIVQRCSAPIICYALKITARPKSSSVVLAMRESLDYAGDKRSPHWFKQLLVNAIEFRSLSHVETVLDEMDPNRSAKIFTARATRKEDLLSTVSRG